MRRQGGKQKQHLTPEKKGKIERNLSYRAVQAIKKKLPPEIPEGLREAMAAAAMKAVFEVTGQALKERMSNAVKALGLSAEDAALTASIAAESFKNLADQMSKLMDRKRRLNQEEKRITELGADYKLITGQ